MEKVCFCRILVTWVKFMPNFLLFLLKIVHCGTFALFVAVMIFFDNFHNLWMMFRWFFNFFWQFIWRFTHFCWVKFILAQIVFVYKKCIFPCLLFTTHCTMQILINSWSLGGYLVYFLNLSCTKGLPFIVLNWRLSWTIVWQDLGCRACWGIL